MRKKIIGGNTPNDTTPDLDWLDLESLAQVELSSEDDDHPIESALKPGSGPGWRASEPGRQTIHLLFDEPVRIRRIHLVFHEPEQQRTQELLLRWTADGGRSYREIVRQHYHFSPPGCTREMEDYEVDLDGLAVLELDITPDMSGGPAFASLAELRLA